MDAKTKDSTCSHEERDRLGRCPYCDVPAMEFYSSLVEARTAKFALPSAMDEYHAENLGYRVR